MCFLLWEVTIKSFQGSLTEADGLGRRERERGMGGGEICQGVL